MSDNIIRNDQIGRIRGTRGDDHLIHHRDPSIQNDHSSIGMSGGPGDDTLEASLPFAGQVHMWGGSGNDTFILDMTNITHHQGHHVYGGVDADHFSFTNISANKFYVTGRIDDYNHSEDLISIEGEIIDLKTLPKIIKLHDGNLVEVRVIQYEQIDILDQGLGPQQVLVIDNRIFYALEGAREKSNLIDPTPGEERHFFTLEDIEKMKLAPSTPFVDPQNFVPAAFYEHRDDLFLMEEPRGQTIEAPDHAVHIHGGKSRENDVSANNWRGSQEIHGSNHGDVINGNTGNDTILGGSGNDLISGGIDDDFIYGGAGEDMIWGGSGNDTILGGQGNDFLDGGFGDDKLYGGPGSDTLVGGRGDDTLTGSGPERADDDVNRFHFAKGDGHDVITDFEVGFDILSFQDDVNPDSIFISHDGDGDTVIMYASDNSVKLKGVHLDDFKIFAEYRMLDEDPILIITPDPELEILRELQEKLGVFGDNVPPAIELDGILYGATAFKHDSPGGYNYDKDYNTKDEQQSIPIEDANLEDSTLPERAIDPEQDDEDEHEEVDDRGGDGSCFVATAAYRDHCHPDVVFLRCFRDRCLQHWILGRKFIWLYWKIGPSIAIPVRKYAILGEICKGMIACFVFLLRKLWSSRNN